MGAGTRARACPAVPKSRRRPSPIAVPQTSDDFARASLGVQWQWFANHDDAWYSLTERSGFLRLFPQPVPVGGLADAPNLLLQKFPARSFTVETSDLATGAAGTEAGLIVIGKTHAELVVERAETSTESDRSNQRLMW